MEAFEGSIQKSYKCNRCKNVPSGIVTLKMHTKQMAALKRELREVFEGSMQNCKDLFWTRCCVLEVYFQGFWS